MRRIFVISHPGKNKIGSAGRRRFPGESIGSENSIKAKTMRLPQNAIRVLRQLYILFMIFTSCLNRLRAV